MKTKLSDLLEKITPLPHVVRKGDSATENEVANVRGVTIFGAYKAVRAIDDAVYLAHAGNVLPELVNAAAYFLTCVLTNGGSHQAGIDRLQAAIAAAGEVNDETTK